MARLAALLLLVLSLTPARSLPSDLTSAAGGAEIGVAVAPPGHEIAPPEAPSRLLIGGPIGKSDSGSGPQPVSDPRRVVCPSTGSAPLARAPLRPAPPSCSPHSQRLPYHATAPPVLG